jgi:hypothetical protein
MEDKFGDLKIWFSCFLSPYSNGQSEVQVWLKDQLVLSAKGNGFLGGMVATTYKAGTWEKQIPGEKQPSISPTAATASTAGARNPRRRATRSTRLTKTSSARKRKATTTGTTSKGGRSL